VNAVDRAKSDFISTIGHELRTPLASVIGYTELLQDGEAGQLSDEQTLLLARVEISAERLGTLVEQLITVARIECESFTVGDRAVNLNLVVERALAATRSTLERPDLEVEVLLDPQTPTVNGAADELERVVVNLLTNAVTNTPDGGRIVVSTHHSDINSYIVVADTGVGIPAPDLEQIFVPFFRSSKSHGRAVPGSGVGLSIAKAIVSAHGDLSVNSEDGHGAVFLVQLPSAPRPHAPGA
jgi:signal transduction histidine kinase